MVRDDMELNTEARNATVDETALVQGLADWVLQIDGEFFGLSSPEPGDAISGHEWTPHRMTFGFSELDEAKLLRLVGQSGALFGPTRMRAGEIRIERVSTELDLLVVERVGQVSEHPQP
jgi:hypothetical protein